WLEIQSGRRECSAWLWQLSTTGQTSTDFKLSPAASAPYSRRWSLHCPGLLRSLSPWYVPDVLMPGFTLQPRLSTSTPWRNDRSAPGRSGLELTCLPVSQYAGQKMLFPSFMLASVLYPGPTVTCCQIKRIIQV